MGQPMPSLKPGQVARFQGSGSVAFNSQGNTYVSGGILHTDTGNYTTLTTGGKLQIQNGGLTVTRGRLTLTGASSTVTLSGVVRKFKSFYSQKIVSTAKKNIAIGKLQYQPNNIFGALTAWDAVGADRSQVSGTH
jgi:hypothetical protein